MPEPTFEELVQGIAPTPPPVDPVTTAVFLGSLIGGALFRRLFGGDSQEDRASNFSQVVSDTFGTGEFNVDFAGFSAFRAAEGSEMFFSRPVFDPQGFQNGTAFFSATDGSLVQVRDGLGNITQRVPGIVGGRFTWTSDSDREKGRDKRRNALEGGLELAIKNELKKKEPLEGIEQTEETRAKARCTGAGMMLVNGTHCASPEEVNACRAAGGIWENGACISPLLPPEGEEPTDGTFEVTTVLDCQEQGRVWDPETQTCVDPPTIDTGIGPVLTGPVPPSPPRSRTGTPTFKVKGTACPPGEVLFNGQCVPERNIPPIPSRSRIPPRSRIGAPSPEDPTFRADVCIPPKIKVPDASAPGGIRCEDPPPAGSPCPPGTIRWPGSGQCMPVPPVVTGTPPSIPEAPPVPKVPCPPGTVPIFDDLGNKTCVPEPPVIPPVPPTTPFPQPRVPRIPGAGLNLSGAKLGGGGGFSFASPISVGGSPGDTLFPALQARVPVLPGTLLDYLAALGR